MTLMFKLTLDYKLGVYVNYFYSINTYVGFL